jgi:hypothetical protein
MPDISGLLPSIGVQLQAQNLQQFGAVVTNQVSGSLNTVFSKNSNASLAFGVSLNSFQPSEGENAVYSPTPYAASLASGIGGFDPKTKFLFKVTFKLTAAALQEAEQYLGATNVASLMDNLTFVVKQIDLPKFSIDYEEINLYNFRTKVIRRIEHQPIAFQMYDDVANNALNFINMYYQLLVPSGRQTFLDGTTLGDYGFAFNAGGIDSGARAALINGGIDILSSMTIDQYYLNRMNPMLQGAQVQQAIYANSYVFSNPRLTTWQIMDQDHANGSDVNMVACEIDFDTLYIVTGQLGTSVNNKNSAGGYVQSNDILGGSGGSLNSYPSNLGGMGQGNFLNNTIQGVMNINARIGNTSVGAIVQSSNLISAGGGLLTTPSSPYGTAAAKTLGNIGNQSPGGINIVSPPYIMDNGASSSTVDSNVDQVDSAYNPDVNNSSVIA